MARYGKKTNLSSSEVIEKAVIFFRDARGLKIVEKSQELVCFENAIGHVTITVCENGQTDVELETREFDYDVREFMRKL
jgi:hypothetical protein